MMKFLNYQSPIVESELDAIEQRFDFELPEEMRQMYLRYNGGRPEKNWFIDHNGPCIVHEVLPIKYGSRASGTLEQSIQRLKLDKCLLPDHLVQFAVDPGGDYFCFSLRSEEYGAVYLFHMDRRDASRAAEFLAGSLGEFLSRLTAKGQIGGGGSSEG